MSTVMRSKAVISKELPVGMAVLVALAVFTTVSAGVSGLVAGDQQQQPCGAGMITKPYMRAGSGPPCVNSDHSGSVSLDPASGMKMADLASTVEGGHGGRRLPAARRKLSSGDTAGSIVGSIVTLIIVVAITWCCCVRICYAGQSQAQAQSQSQSQSQATAQATSNSNTNNMSQVVNVPKQEPTFQYHTTTYNLAPGQLPIMPTHGAGDSEMQGPIMATGTAGNAFALAQAGGGGFPGVHHNLPAGFPAPGIPAYTPQAHHAPPAQQFQQYPVQPQQVQQYPTQPQSPLSNHPSDEKPAESPLLNYPPKQQ